MENHIRNFCIIAHIDHGKSTLADRLLEVTGTVPQREMRAQMLDQMDIERERGITIKLQPVRMLYRGFELNLIDTPGHVDFTYEVSRSLAAVEGAILLVDATQGIQAQTLSHLYLAIEHNLEIIPVINKIDLPNADTDSCAKQLIKLLGCAEKDILLVSGKTGQGVAELLDAVIQRVTPPKGTVEHDVAALVFDSHFDSYRGVVAHCRVVEGSIIKGDRIRFLGTRAEAEVLEVGTFAPKFHPEERLNAGSIGYVVTNVKGVRDCRVGDTIVRVQAKDAKALPGYRQLQPMVFAGIFCQEGDEYPALRDALEKLQLNDAALIFEPEHSPALGYGFRCGLLGLLHLDIVQERLKREYDLHLVITVPSVAYAVFLNEAGMASLRKKIKHDVSPRRIITSPQDFPERSQIDHIEEPWVAASMVVPQEYMGSLMQFVQDAGGVYKTTEYLSEERVVLHYDMPLSALLVDFYDKMKSVTSGYASLSYEVVDYRPCVVERLDIIIADDLVEALATIVYSDQAQRIGRAVTERLKDVVPKQMFEVKIQAALGGKVVASSRIAPMRKDVTAKLYGGDVTRKRKLLEKQKKGKKRMRQFGKVTLPQEAFLAVLKR
ncbi:MAG: translation elongation factor 4 [Patescibacteria group bacterium]|jgi:GTP-binding protein LepA